MYVGAALPPLTKSDRRCIHDMHVCTYIHTYTDACYIHTEVCYIYHRLHTTYTQVCFLAPNEAALDERGKVFAVRKVRFASFASPHRTKCCADTYVLRTVEMI